MWSLGEDSTVFLFALKQLLQLWQWQQLLGLLMSAQARPTAPAATSMLSYTRPLDWRLSNTDFKAVILAVSHLAELVHSSQLMVQSDNTQCLSSNRCSSPGPAEARGHQSPVSDLGCTLLVIARLVPHLAKARQQATAFYFNLTPSDPRNTPSMCLAYLKKSLIAKGYSKRVAKTIVAAFIYHAPFISGWPSKHYRSPLIAELIPYPLLQTGGPILPRLRKIAICPPDHPHISVLLQPDSSTKENELAEKHTSSGHVRSLYLTARNWPSCWSVTIAMLGCVRVKVVCFRSWKHGSTQASFQIGVKKKKCIMWN